MAFSSRFLDGDPAATALLSDGFRRPSDRAEAVRAAAARTVRPELVAALERQAGAYGARPAQREGIATLARGGAAAVVVGQQVGLHLGPLYTVHKAAAAIATARALATETGTPCVPVFWLQTEDHDLEEIRAVTIPAAPEPLRLSVPDDGRDGVSIRHRVLPDAVTEVNDALAADVGRLAHGADVVAWVARHWRPGVAWHTAFAGALTELFGDDGLILIDPREPAIAALAAPLYVRALDEAAPIAAALAERGRALRAAGFDEQVHVREGAPLVFFHPDGPEGPRVRLEPEGDGWRMSRPDRWVWSGEVRERAPRLPLVFSTSALLRPIVQDTLLPTALTLGGPGEIGYFAQLPPVYDHFGLPLPLVGPRAHFRLVDGKAARLLAELDLAPADLDAPRDELLGRLVARRDDALPSPVAARSELEAEARAVVDRFAARTDALGPVLDDAYDRTRRTLAHALGKLADRYERELARHDEVTAGRVDRLRVLLRPDGAPQERVYGIAGWAARYGLRALAETLVAACVPFDGRMRDVHLEDADGEGER